MARQFVKIEGLKELDEALKDLSRVTAGNAVKRALARAAAPILATAKALVPVDTGKLRDSLVISAKLSKRQTRIQRRIDAKGRSEGGGKSTKTIYVGAGALPHAHLQEFGTVRHGPQPFLRPAWEQNKMTALNGLKAALWIEISKSAERARRKNAARIAKAKA